MILFTFMYRCCCQNITDQHTYINYNLWSLLLLLQVNICIITVISGIVWSRFPQHTHTHMYLCTHVYLYILSAYNLHTFISHCSYLWTFADDCSYITKRNYHINYIQVYTYGCVNIMRAAMSSALCRPNCIGDNCKMPHCVWQ